MDGGDFLAWQRAVGAVSSTAAGVVTPEPGAGLLLMLGCGMMAVVQRR